MSKTHNKKRNTGLLYEFLVRTISKSLVEGDQKKSSVALKIIKKFFKPGTQLYNEFRLINALVKTSVSSTPVAASILSEAKEAAKDYDAKSLDREKSLLIRTINHSLNESGFYDQHVDNYKMYATIQTLLNDWRDNTKRFDIEKRAQYEDKLISWLITEKSADQDITMGDQTLGTNKILSKIMMEKLNEKYQSQLSTEQKDIIRSYVWSTTNDEPERIKRRLTEVKESLLGSMNAYSESPDRDDYVCGQLNEAKARLQQEDLDAVDDDTITRFMLYMKLNDELGGENE